MTIDERNRAEEMLAKHAPGILPALAVDAMLAFAAEEVKAERERCVRIINDMDLASYPHTKYFGSEYIAAINAGAANEDVDTGRRHTKAQDNLPAASAPIAAPEENPPDAPDGENVAGLAPHRRVVCAAIRAADGDLLLGIRHYSHDMFLQMERTGFNALKFQRRLDEDQGFVDQHGVYMSREEAYKVALAAGQIIYPGRCGEGLDGKKLYSEGLY